MIWDFSKLESLHIRTHCGRSFVQTVPPQAVSGIRVLHLEDTIGFPVPYNYDAFIPLELMGNFLGGLKGLLEITLTCLSPAKVIQLLSQHSKALEVLRLGDRNLRDPSMAVNDLILIEASFPNLSELQLDLDFPLFEPSQKLDTFDDEEKALLIRVSTHVSPSPKNHSLRI